MVRVVDLYQLIGFACQTLLYGVYCILFLASGYVLYYIRRSRGTNKIIIILNCLLFVSCTLHFAMEFNHYYTYLGHKGVDGIADENPESLIADIIVSTTDFLGDLIVIYRCWVIWQRNYYVVLLPLLSATAGLILSAVIGQLVNGTTNAVVAREIVPLGLASFILPLCTNVMVTSLIIGRIWYMSRDTSLYVVHANSGTRKAMNIIVESGALYFVAQLVFVVTYAMQHPAEYILLLMVVPIYGIASTLIIIHVGLGLSSDQSSLSMSTIDWAPTTQDHHISVDMPHTPATQNTVASVDTTELAERKDKNGRTLRFDIGVAV